MQRQVRPLLLTKQSGEQGLDEERISEQRFDANRLDDQKLSEIDLLNETGFESEEDSEGDEELGGDNRDQLNGLRPLQRRIIPGNSKSMMCIRDGLNLQRFQQVAPP